MSKEWKEPRPNNAVRIFQDPNIPKREFEREFTRKDFRMLVKVLSVVLAKWEGIGDCLRIVHKMMGDLQDKCKKNSTMGLISVVDEWMKGNYDEKKLYPCWYSVVYVVADGSGGQNPNAARNIAQRWKMYEDDPFFSCLVAKEAAVDITELYTLDDIDGSRRRFIQQLWTDYLQSVGHRWFEIGVLLGVPIYTLQTIETNKLVEVIQVWINLYDDFRYNYLPAPTIQILVDAVDNIMGGNDQALAKRIADNVKAPVPSSSNGSIAHSSTSTSVTQADPQRLQEQTVSTGVQAFNTTMTADKLCLWLRSNQLPESDCQIILGQGIGGRAFKHLTELKWSSYGISDVGLIVLRDIMGEICPAVPDPGKREMTTGRSSASNGTVDACAPSLPASALPASARPYLELQLDWGNQGVDRDLVKIAHLMVGWEEKLCSHLGLTDVDVHDIIEKYKGNPELQRKEALRIWKNNQALRATYGNLLELFVRAHHAQCAEVVREIIRKKCENQTTKYPL